MKKKETGLGGRHSPHSRGKKGRLISTLEGGLEGKTKKGTFVYKGGKRREGKETGPLSEGKKKRIRGGKGRKISSNFLVGGGGGKKEAGTRGKKESRFIFPTRKKGGSANLVAERGRGRAAREGWEEKKGVAPALGWEKEKRKKKGSY